MRTIAYDVTGVNLFPRKLMRFPRKKEAQMVRPILLQAGGQLKFLNAGEVKGPAILQLPVLFEV